MRWNLRPILLLLLGLLALGGCRRPSPPLAPEPPSPPPVNAPPKPPGLLVSGFWNTWGLSLAECLRVHRARQGEACRGALGITVKKSSRRMVVTCDGIPVKGYFIALGRDPQGPKQRRGDGRTPEGTYYLWGKNWQSRFYLSLGVSYPNPTDAARGLRQGLISPTMQQRIASACARQAKPPQHTRLGGNIFIHGGGIGEVVRRGARKYVRIRDWTAGCVALRNADMEELLALLPVGIPVRILP